MPGENSELGFDLDSSMNETAGSLGLEVRGAESPAPAPTPAADESEVAATPAVAGALAETATTAAAPAVTSPPPTPGSNLERAPNGWKPDIAAAWPTLPENVRAEIHRRESDFHNGLATYREAAETGRQYQQVMAPYMGTMQQYGIDPLQQVGSLMQAHYTLALGSPQDKIALFKQIAADYQVDLSQLSGEAPYVDPAVSALQQRLQSIESVQQQSLRQAQEAQRREVQQKVEAFFSDPANKYANDCWPQIETLVRAGTPLEEAYKQAIWMNPEVRAKVIAEQEQAAKEAREKAAREAAAKAATATTSTTRVQAKGFRPTATPGSMDETLQETLKEIKSRS